MQLHRIKKKYVKCNCGAEMIEKQSEKVNKKNSAILPKKALNPLSFRVISATFKKQVFIVTSLDSFNHVCRVLF